MKMLRSGSRRAHVAFFLPASSVPAHRGTGAGAVGPRYAGAGGGSGRKGTGAAGCSQPVLWCAGSPHRYASWYGPGHHGACRFSRPGRLPPRVGVARVSSDPAHVWLEMGRDHLVNSGTKIEKFVYQLTPNVSESDGLPAVIPFSPHASLVNIDYVRILDPKHQVVTNVAALINPKTGAAKRNSRSRTTGTISPIASSWLPTTLKDCDVEVKNRQGDLFFSDDLPEALRQALLDLVTPIYNHFAQTLGSEPALTFIVWRPDAPGGGSALNATGAAAAGAVQWIRMAAGPGPEAEGGVVELLRAGADRAQARIAGRAR